MVAPTNLEFFETLTLALFQQLYQSFPVPIDIDPMKLAYSFLPENVEGEDGLRLFGAAEHTVAFLKREGFIEHGDMHLDDGTYVDVSLTSKGLLVMDSMPAPLSGSSTVAGEIRDLLGEVAKDGVKDGVREGAKRIITYILTSASSIMSAS
ncbi:hypothetical protein ACQQ2N_06900 [Dokdonella sp. MW10]|uniref:hypothetical protein n=1 Tax=Dokdonella sp. MW10 TaxID=2992926 RepID=UPI003F81D7D1